MNEKFVAYILYWLIFVSLLFITIRTAKRYSKVEVSNDYVGKPRAGDIFYSKYFKTNGMVVEYKDDNNWWFMLQKDGQYSKPILKARCKPYEVSWVQRMREV